MNKPPSLSSHPYASFLHRVAKPARYVGGEINQKVKDPGGTSVRMALAFPDLYDIGMSHLGTKILYSILNKDPRIAAERVFCPWTDMEQELRSRKLPLLTLETASPLSQFDVVGFSLQYELTYTNVLTMLDLSGIPFRAEDRDASHPLIIAGGPCATQPEPMAPFMDAFLIGDAEAKLPELLHMVAACRDAGTSRGDTLTALARMGGLYCPALYSTREDERTGYRVVDDPLEEAIPAKIERIILEDINAYPFPDDSPVADAEAIFDRMSVEIARGCTEGCRFCQAGMIYRPVRERSPENIVDTLVRAVHKGGYDEASLTTLSTADYSCISPLIKRVMEKLRPERVSLSVASLRAYGLDEATLEEIRSVRANGLTFAPEAGTQRLRDVINKNISQEDLERTADRVFSRGWRRMKLYFMIGLPTETEEDVVGIMETGRSMKAIGRRYHGGRAGVTVSVSSHVPKPHTPFQWVAMDSLEDIEAKQEILHRLARKYRLEFRRHDPRTTYLECILGRGDRRMADVLEAVWRRGARFDSWDEQLAWDAWTETLEEHRHIPYKLFTGTLPTDARLPWDHLDMKLGRKFLLTDYRRSLKNKLSPPCGKPVGTQVHHTNLEDHEKDERTLVCYHCGVECDLGQMRVQRGAFLKTLKAVSSPVRRETVPVSGIEPAPRVNGNGKKERPRPPRQEQTQSIKYRVRYRKTGFMTLTGHLDFVRALPRVLRRAGIGMHYSLGFHPKPVMEFTPPLPLGMEGLGEVVDIALTASMDERALLAGLQASAPEGLTFVAAERVTKEMRKISKSFGAAEYLVFLSDEKLRGQSSKGLHAATATFLAEEQVVLAVTRKRRRKEIDIRPGVADLAWIAPGELPSGVDSPPQGRFLYVCVDLECPSHTRPEEVVEAMFGPAVPVETVDIVRLGFVPVAEPLRSFH